MSLRWRNLGLMVLLSVSACGDDAPQTADSGSAPTDSGPEPVVEVDAAAGTDSGPPDSGGEPDAEVVPEGCDPFAGGDCLAQEKCSVVLDIDEQDQTFAVFYGCADADRAKGEGIPCAQGRDAEPRDGIRGRTDDCQEGLFCSNRNRPPGSPPVCQRMCDRMTVDCGDLGYCSGINSDPFIGLCVMASACDPVLQTGCETGEACFVLGATNDDIVSDCFDWEPLDGFEGIHGDPCTFLNNCAPGHSCRPVTDTTAECRQLCDATGLTGDAGGDAGAEQDAGVPDANGGADAGQSAAGACPSDLVCIPLTSMGETRTPTPSGICVTPAP